MLMLLEATGARWYNFKIIFYWVLGFIWVLGYIILLCRYIILMCCMVK